MKVRYFIAGIIVAQLTYFGCTTKNDVPDSQLINEIIKETIKQDSLDTSLPISNELINYYLYEVELEKETDTLYPPPPPPPPPPTSVEKGKPLTLYYFRLNQQKIIGYTISREDSVFFERQIKNFKNIVLDSMKLKDIIRVEDNIHIKTNTYRSQKIYKFLIPLFNSSKTMAWVEYKYLCPRCGYGRMVIFKRNINGWTKINSYSTWMN